MGADMNSFVEVKNLDGKWIKNEEFGEFYDCRNYSVYGFLANVRNYSHSEFLYEYKGFPNDSEFLNSDSPDDYWLSQKKPTVKQDYEYGGYYGIGWLLLTDILAFNYDKIFWDRRISIIVSYNSAGQPNVFSRAGEAQNEETEGTHPTYREFLGTYFFSEVDRLKALDPNPENIRIILWFS